MSKNTWDKYIVEAHQQMMKDSDTRELGKIRAVAAEYAAKDWINQNTNIRVNLASQVGAYSDKNGSGFDLVSENGLRIQVKYRGTDFHLETTRRNSDKNQGNASKTGHVAYSINECDVFLFVVPNYESENPMESKFIAIPTKELENPLNEGFCVTRVKKKLVNKYENCTSETLKRLEANASENFVLVGSD